MLQFADSLFGRNRSKSTSWLAARQLLAFQTTFWSYCVWLTRARAAKQRVGNPDGGHRRVELVSAWCCTSVRMHVHVRTIVVRRLDMQPPPLVSLTRDSRLLKLCLLQDSRWLSTDVRGPIHLASMQQPQDPSELPKELLD
eukprot:922479-Amphidinium_carterae.1